MKTILILAASAAAIYASPAVAQTASSQLVVSYADLDLSNAHGQRVLDRRLRSAVESVCGPTSSADPRGKNEVRQCRSETLAQARAQRDVAIAAAGGPSEIRLAAQR